MNYKDKFYLYTYSRKNYKYKSHPFRFRFEPVPHTGGDKPCIYGGCRHMRTTHERKWSFAYDKYVRGKRSAYMLPNSWDDYWHARREKGWKRTKKERQWMEKGDKLMKKDLSIGEHFW